MESLINEFTIKDICFNSYLKPGGLEKKDNY